ncbi:MAG TPA: hypothetical protein PLM89_03175 [Anaerolineales bacterium]|nr:hypothetical protein [Anaerolineales bacterium]
MAVAPPNPTRTTLLLAKASTNAGATLLNTYGTRADEQGDSEQQTNR